MRTRSCTLDGARGSNTAGRSREMDMTKRKTADALTAALTLVTAALAERPDRFTCVGGSGAWTPGRCLRVGTRHDGCARGDHAVQPQYGVAAARDRNGNRLFGPDTDTNRYNPIATDRRRGTTKSAARRLYTSEKGMPGLTGAVRYPRSGSVRISFYRFESVYAGIAYFRFNPLSPAATQLGSGINIESNGS